jgi:hypothetical protein
MFALDAVFNLWVNWGIIEPVSSVPMTQAAMAILPACLRANLSEAAEAIVTEAATPKSNVRFMGCIYGFMKYGCDIALI